MGGGNGQKSASKRERNAAKLAAPKGSQLKQNTNAMSLKCHVCLQSFVCTSSEAKLKEHSENKHPKQSFEQCFPDFAPPQ